MSDFESTMRHFAEIDEHMANAIRDAAAGDTRVPDRLREDGYPRVAEQLERLAKQ